MNRERNFSQMVDVSNACRARKPAAMNDDPWGVAEAHYLYNVSALAICQISRPKSSVTTQLCTFVSSHIYLTGHAIFPTVG